MSATTVFGWAVCGLIVGLVTRLLIRGEQRLGLLATLALGVGWSLAGGFLNWVLQGAPRELASPAGTAWQGWATAILGAVAFLLVCGALNPWRWWRQ